MGRPGKLTPQQEAVLRQGWVTWTTPKSERRFIILGAVARVLLRQPIVSADDLHTELRQDEYPWDRRAFGAVLRGLHQKGRLVPLGYRASTRPECHGRPILDYREATK